ncbi:hypothetical protein [Amphritea sp. HPY]|uniref:hypothetical protein n=1 Tax=Amphritea sp. HPY TaxID=3421652 RepID=UPI003D7C9C1A
MKKLIDDYIAMNRAGRVLELCEKYYDENVVMLNNGAVFAESMRESYDKQKGFVESVTAFDVRLVNRQVEGNVSKLTFHYKMTGADAKVTEFTGKHIQTWQNGKIIREEYVSVNQA